MRESLLITNTPSQHRPLIHLITMNQSGYHSSHNHYTNYASEH